MIEKTARVPNPPPLNAPPPDSLAERDRLAERLLAARDEIADLKSAKRALESELVEVQHAAGRLYRTVQRNAVQLEAAYWRAKLLRAGPAGRSTWRRILTRLGLAIRAARLAFAGVSQRSPISPPHIPVPPSPTVADDPAAVVPVLRHSRETVLAPLPGFATQGRQTERFTLAVLIFGLEEGRVAGILERIGVELDRRPNFAPLFITDSKAFALFRREGYSFEYLPGAADWDRLAPDLDWPEMLRRRAELLRAKWRPEAVVAFGKTPPSLVDLLRS